MLFSANAIYLPNYNINPKFSQSCSHASNMRARQLH